MISQGSQDGEVHSGRATAHYGQEEEHQLSVLFLHIKLITFSNKQVTCLLETQCLNLV
jgi:hypothetical protein